MNWKRRSAAALTAVGLGAVLFSLSAVVAPPEGSPSENPSAAAQVSQPADATGVRALLDRLDRVPTDWTAWNALGDAYLRLGTSTADTSYYRRAEEAFDRSLKLRSKGNDGAHAGAGALAAARHDFEAALRLARRALSLNPYSPAALGVQVDALVELGRYAEAERTLQRMLDIDPSTASFARASYYRELHGDIRGARLALQDALAFASAQSDKSFALFYLGELAWSQGRLAAADRYYLEGLRQDPTYTALLAGRAKVAAARGEVATALARYEQVVRRLPVPAYLIAYADLLRSLEREEEAARQEVVIEATRALFEDQGVDVDLEIALYDADRGRGESALRAARAVWERQRSIHAADAYAWALHVSGRNTAALRLSDRAARLGTRSALFSFHRGMIERALGRTNAARVSLERALELNPSFSPLLAPRAEAALADLGPR